jgi:hypothetical protein
VYEKTRFRIQGDLAGALAPYLAMAMRELAAADLANAQRP